MLVRGVIAIWLKDMLGVRLIVYWYAYVLFFPLKNENAYVLMR
jgi:hypothetical protein